jgi:hypothetical protein
MSHTLSSPGREEGLSTRRWVPAASWLIMRLPRLHRSAPGCVAACYGSVRPGQLQSSLGTEGCELWNGRRGGAPGSLMEEDEGR